MGALEAERVERGEDRVPDRLGGGDHLGGQLARLPEARHVYGDRVVGGSEGTGHRLPDGPVCAERVHQHEGRSAAAAIVGECD